jgi:hypothetical protein
MTGLISFTLSYVIKICILKYAFVCRMFLVKYLYKSLNTCTKGELPMPVTALSKAWFCGSSLAEILGSNPAGRWGGGGLA